MPRQLLLWPSQEEEAADRQEAADSTYEWNADYSRTDEQIHHFISYGKWL